MHTNKRMRKTKNNSRTPNLQDSPRRNSLGRFDGVSVGGRNCSCRRSRFSVNCAHRRELTPIYLVSFYLQLFFSHACRKDCFCAVTGKKNQVQRRSGLRAPADEKSLFPQSEPRRHTCQAGASCHSVVKSRCLLVLKRHVTSLALL